eukprot:5299267-Pleurochrysis_carterae.AAC.1
MENRERKACKRVCGNCLFCFKGNESGILVLQRTFGEESCTHATVQGARGRKQASRASAQKPTARFVCQGQGLHATTGSTT